SSGEFYKSQGNFLFTDPTGPFGYGGYRILPALPPYWTELQRYEETYGMQMNRWKGHRQFLEMVRGMWAARGDTPAAPNPNINNLRAWLSANFDVDTSLASMAIRVWSGGWDNFNHNHFTWRRENGKWVIVQWDFDGELDLSYTNSNIYLSEYGAPLNYPPFAGPPAWVDANWLNDSFFKAFRLEYRRKLWTLNNTLLNPTNITAIGLGSFRPFADTRFGSVNAQLAFGAFQRPRTPTNLAPARLQSVFPPAILMASAYSHPALPAPVHASTTWWIRSTNGSYAAPLFKRTSMTNLTSLPIPFDQLTFGQTYFWKCAYTDADGHPSFDSAESQFIYGAEPSFAPVIRLDAATQWRFNTNGVVLPASWRTPEYDDSTWSEGPALIADDTGPLPEPIRTPIMRSNRLVTYFRKAFVFNGNPAGAYFRIHHVVDDGVVVWLNGAEIHRIGLAGAPGTVVGNTTPANRQVVDARYEGPFLIVPTNLLIGTNILAASVHRTSTVTPDVVFGLTLDIAVPPVPGNVVLNEVMADNRNAVTNGMGYPDYVELYNNTDQEQSLDGLSLSDNVQRPGKFVFPPATRIPAGGYLVVWCDNETNAPGLHAGFALDNDGQTVALFTLRTNGYVLADSVSFGLQIPDFSIGRSTDGTGGWVLTHPTPGANHMDAVLGPPVPLKINEWMATDAGSDDWLELYNPSELPVALGGLSLTDNTNLPAKSVIAPLSFIAAGGFRQFLADERPDLGARHVDFKLSGNGELIGLYDSSRARIDLIVFGPQFSGVSEGRLPDGSDNVVAFPGTASPEEANHLPIESIVINEVLAHSDPPLEDVVELLNLTSADVDVSGWWLSDEAGRLRKYRIPAGTTIPANGFLTIYENQFNANASAENSFAFNSARGDDVYLSAADPGGALTGHRTEAHFGPSESGVSIGRFATSQGVVFVALSRRTFGADQAGSVEEFRTGAGAPNADAKVGPVVISEVQYHPRDLAGGADNDLDEFIELRNISATSVPLFNPLAPPNANTWRLRDAVDFTFPEGTSLLPNETVLVVGFDPVTNAAALNTFRDAYGPISARMFGPWSGKLDNSSDSVELVKADNPVTEPGVDFGFVP
ncbi:MAG TPA: lamin tail domain-containing protein, partial [Verrucomicrobiae bacterium]|nr:lamin tail domain-containing protein [Verrucomicrobiae bacterium]